MMCCVYAHVFDFLSQWYINCVWSAVCFWLMSDGDSVTLSMELRNAEERIRDLKLQNEKHALQCASMERAYTQLACQLKDSVFILSDVRSRVQVLQKHIVAIEPMDDCGACCHSRRKMALASNSL